jgi:glutaredoxin 3
MNTDDTHLKQAVTPTSPIVNGAVDAKVRLYDRAFCPYCMTAKRILRENGFTWTEIRVDNDPNALDEMLRRTRGETQAPQIFINGRYLGGLEELMMVEHLKEWPQYIRLGDAKKNANTIDTTKKDHN